MPVENTTSNGGSQETTQNTTVTFDDNQKAAITSIIEERLTRQKTAHQKELEAKEAEIAAKVEAALAAERERAKGGKEGKVDDDAEKAQYKALIDAEKARTKAASDALAEESKKRGELESTNKKILKDVAISRAITDQDTFHFHNTDVVKVLTEGRIVFDDETGQYQVKDENGVIMQNNSLQPMSLKEFYSQFASQHPYLVSSNAKGGTGAGESNRTVAGGLAKVTSKADLKTVKEKSEFIAKFGYDAFEKLPVK